MKKIIAIMVALMMLLTVDALAKTSGGRSTSFGSKSFSKSPSITRNVNTRRDPVVNHNTNTFTKKINTNSTVTPSNKKPFKFGSVSTPATPSTPSNPVQTKLYAKFKADHTPPKQVNASNINTMFDKNYRKNSRSRFYNTYTPPTYTNVIVQQHPSYGVWDAMLMWSFLDNISDRNMYYHHMNEPAFVSWRNDANQLCAQGNVEVCNKLRELDQEVNTIKATGVKQNKTYITDGVEPGIYLSDNVKYDDLGEVKVCTGTLTSAYTRFANQLAKSTKLKIVPVYTNGSIENLQNMASGSCDMAFTQPDTMVTSELEQVFSLNKPEQLMLLCNRNSGVKHVNDLTSNHTVYIGSDQTGSNYTFKSLAGKNIGGTSNVKVESSLPTIAYANKVGYDDNACLFTVSTFDAPYIKNLAKEGRVLFTAFDKVDGYIPSYIDDNAVGDTYKNITQNKYKSRFAFWSQGTPMLAMKPVLVTTATWAQNNPVVLYDVIELNKSFLQRELQ